MILRDVLLVATAAALAGCGGAVDPSSGSGGDSAASAAPAGTTVKPTPQPGGTGIPRPVYGPAIDPKAVDANLASLRALDVVEVGQLIVEYPDGAMNCYGPCPGFEPAIEAAKDKAGERLASLLSVAELAVRSPIDGACTQATIDENVAALQALQIVDVGGLVQEHPENDTRCYGAPCPGDVQAAEERTCARAGKLASIVSAAKGL